MIDNSRLVLYNNEIVKVSLFSRKGAKEYHGSKEEIKFIMAPLVFLGTVLTHL